MWIGDFLCFAGTNFCNKDRLVFLAGNYFFGDFQSFLLSTCHRNTYFQTILSVRQYFSQKKRPVVIEQTRFLGTVFLCSEFKLEHTVFPLE